VFFERFRSEMARLPAGLIRAGAAASAEAIAAAQAALGVALPGEYASFLRSFDGADLFHESVVIAGVGPAAPRLLSDLNPARPVADLVFAETVAGDRFVLAAAGGVARLRAGSDERVLAGSGFLAWLDATLAREALLYGPDGEFAPEAFEPDGEEVTPRTALRQAERALRFDPGSAEAHLDRGVALRRLGRAAEAAASFARAGELDAGNPWPFFDLGRTLLDGDPRRAGDAFARAAAVEPGAAGARFLAWAARAALAAGDVAGARAAREEARRRDPSVTEQLRRALDASAEAGDEDAAAEAGELCAAMDDAAPAAPIPARLRLPMAPPGPPARAKAAPARRPPPAPPRRPRRAGRPR